MPTEDAAIVQSPADAARYTGQSQSVMTGIGTEADPGLGVYGVDFPTDGMTTSRPTAADAAENPNFL
jgi:hypothetical protein